MIIAFGSVVFSRKQTLMKWKSFTFLGNTTEADTSNKSVHPTSFGNQSDSPGIVEPTVIHYIL